MQAAKNWCDGERVKKLGIWRWSKRGPKFLFYFFWSSPTVTRSSIPCLIFSCLYTFQFLNPIPIRFRSRPTYLCLSKLSFYYLNQKKNILLFFGSSPTVTRSSIPCPIFSYLLFLPSICFFPCPLSLSFFFQSSVHFPSIFVASVRSWLSPISPWSSFFSIGSVRGYVFVCFFSFCDGWWVSLTPFFLYKER